MTVRLTEYAREDLRDIHSYIANRLQNPIAAKSTVAKIRNSYAGLADNPYIGTPLAAKTDKKTNKRFLVSGSYIIIYRVKDNVVDILRIYNGRQNYIKDFFNNFLDEEE